MAQAAQALAGSLAASVAASQSAAQPRASRGSEEQPTDIGRQALQPFPEVLSGSMHCLEDCFCPLQKHNTILSHTWTASLGKGQHSQCAPRSRSLCGQPSDNSDCARAQTQQRESWTEREGNGGTPPAMHMPASAAVRGTRCGSEQPPSSAASSGVSASAPAMASVLPAGPARVTGSGDTPWSQRGGTSSVGASAVILSAATGPVTGMLDTWRHAGEAVGDYVLYRF